MDKVIVYTQDNGTVAIITPAVSVEHALKDVPTEKEYKIIDVANLPTDRTFRDAWVLDEDTIKVDATKQAAIQTKLDAMENE